MKAIYYIVPAMSDLSGQCRIVVKSDNSERTRAFYRKHPEALADVSRMLERGNIRDCYRKYPELWAEAGHMNFQGKVVCFSGSKATLEELRSMEPLMAGLHIVTDEADEIHA